MRKLAILALVSGTPLAVYVATASGHGYWFDGGEFVAASAQLGISHPPGHPLAALVGAALTLLPLGPMAFRTALASALCAAVATGFLYQAIGTTVRTLGVRRDRIVVPVAIGATWLVVFSYGFWFQAVRPEVYALQAALVCAALERLIAFEARWPDGDFRPLYAASLCLGLALSNHHFLAFLLLPAMAPTVARVLRARGIRPLLPCAAFISTGLLTYLYLPLRAAADPALNLGEPTTLSRLYWVVSAQAFQKNTGGGVPQPIHERFADIAVQGVESLHIAVIALALGGVYAVLRKPMSRRVGAIWILVAVIFVAARAWLGFVRSNPDALGYLIPAFAAAGALAAAFVATILVAIGRADLPRPSWLAVALAWLLPMAGLWQLSRTHERATLGSFAATDCFESAGRRELPLGAVVLAHDPQSIFRYWGGESAERLRPDVTFVPMPFLTYPGMVDRLVSRDPQIKDLLRGYLLEGALGIPELQTLAGQRPVLVEMDPRVPQEVFETIVPHGLYHEVLPDRAYRDDRRQGRDSRELALAVLEELLGDEGSETETRNRLLWNVYMAAVFYAGTGDHEAAKRSVARAREINPQAQELIALESALASVVGDDPLDIAPFLPQRLR